MGSRFEDLRVEIQSLSVFVRPYPELCFLCGGYLTAGHNIQYINEFEKEVAIYNAADMMV